MGSPSIQEVPVSRSVPLVSLAAGTAFAAVGALELTLGQASVFASTSDYVIEWLFVVALALAVGVLVRLARANDDRATVTAFAIAVLGHAAMCVAAVATAVAGRESLDVLFPIGVLLALVGLIVLAVQDLRRRVVPERVGLVLAAAFALTFPAEALVGAGSLLLATGWLAVARLSSRPDRVPALVA